MMPGKLKWYVILALALWLAFSGVAAAEQLYVNEGGWWREGGAFNVSETPIQAAVDAAGEGDAIYVEGSDYNENVDVDKPRLTLEGEGANVVTVTAASKGDHVFEVTADYVNISGFTVTMTTSYQYAGIYLNSADHCNIYENTASDNGCGIRLSSSSNNTLENNNASNNGCGIRLSSSSNNTLESNAANSNIGVGIILESSSNNTLAHNTANSNTYGIVLYSSSCNNTVTGNMLSNNYGSIYLYSSCDNDVTCNLVQNNTNYGIYLTSGSTGNNITCNNIVANGELQTDGSYHSQFNNFQSDDVDAINNYWGAGMNNSTIDASIYDDDESSYLGKVEFYPFETEPVPCAPTPEGATAFTTADTVIALQIAAGSRPYDSRWDVSGDGSVTSLDALMILQAATGCMKIG